MKINTINHSDINIIKDEDFFKAFEEPKENFHQQIPEQPKADNQGNSIDKDFFEDDKVKILSYEDKLNISDFFVVTITNYIDDLANGYTGKNQKGRYMPSSESMTKIKGSLAKLLPDKFRVPEWLKLVILLFFAYQPIIKRVRTDAKG